MSAYRVAPKQSLHGAKPGDAVELGEAEAEVYLASGQIEIVPERYEVTGPRTVLGNEPGSTFEAALSVGQRDSLIAAGHIASAKAAKTTKSPKGGTKKEKK